MSSQQSSVQEETGISREHITASSEEYEVRCYNLADCLRELQEWLQGHAEEMPVDLGSWSGNGALLLCAPEEQYLQLGSILEWSDTHMVAAQRAHFLEAEERKGEVPLCEPDNLLVVQ